MADLIPGLDRGPRESNQPSDYSYPNKPAIDRHEPSHENTSTPVNPGGDKSYGHGTAKSSVEYSETPYKELDSYHCNSHTTTTTSSLPGAQYSAASTSESTAPPTSSHSTGTPKRLHVTNIPFRFRETELRELFYGYGELVHAEIIFNARGSKGFGFVTFSNEEDALKAKAQVSGCFIDGRKVEVNEATPRTSIGVVTSASGRGRGGTTRPWSERRGGAPAGRGFSRGAAANTPSYGQSYGYGGQSFNYSNYNYSNYPPQPPPPHHHGGPPSWSQGASTWTPGSSTYGSDYPSSYSPQHYRQSHDYRYAPY